MPECINGRHIRFSAPRFIICEAGWTIVKMMAIWNAILFARNANTLKSLEFFLTQVERDDSIYLLEWKCFFSFTKKPNLWKFVCKIENSFVSLMVLRRLTIEPFWHVDRIDKNDIKFAWFQQPHIINTCTLHTPRCLNLFYR